MFTWQRLAGETDHVLSVARSTFGSHVRIVVDGRAVLELDKPTPRTPLRTGELVFDGQAVGVALTWTGSKMGIDVFVDGRSTVDGRAVSELKDRVPAPSSRYNSWFWFPTDLRLASFPLVKPWSASLVVIAAISLVVAPIPLLIVRVPAGLLLFWIWFWWWFVLSARAHRYLMPHQELGDFRRVLTLSLVFFGYPALWLGPIAIATGLGSR